MYKKGTVCNGPKLRTNGRKQICFGAAMATDSTTNNSVVAESDVGIVMRMMIYAISGNRMIEGRVDQDSLLSETSLNCSDLAGIIVIFGVPLQFFRIGELIASNIVVQSRILTERVMVVIIVAQVEDSVFENIFPHCHRLPDGRQGAAVEVAVIAVVVALVIIKVQVRHGCNYTGAAIITSSGCRFGRSGRALRYCIGGGIALRGWCR